LPDPVMPAPTTVGTVIFVPEGSDDDPTPVGKRVYFAQPDLKGGRS